MPNVRPRNIFQHASQRHLVPRNARSAHRISKYTRSSQSVLQLQPQPSVISEDGHRTLRLRQHGNKSLPLPPLMDPIAIEAKQRFKQPKMVPGSQDTTEFQKALWRDANAQALATTVRQCAVTKARLPSHFLLPFSTILGQQHSANDSTPQNPTPRLVPLTASDLSRGKSIGGSSTYILNRRSLLEHLNSKHRWANIVTPRMQDAYGKRVGKRNVRVEKDWLWDAEMLDLVLKQLREQVVKRLRECVGYYKNPIIVPLREGHAVEEGHVMAFIDLAPADTPTRNQEVGDSRPVYSLHELLGQDGVPTFMSEREELKTAHQFAILRHSYTVKLLLALERLRMYTMARAR